MRINSRADGTKNILQTLTKFYILNDQDTVNNIQKNIKRYSQHTVNNISVNHPKKYKKYKKYKK